MIENFVQSIKNHIPIGITFKTPNKKYMYDAGTGKVIECQDVEYEILQHTFNNELDALYELENKYKKEEVESALDNIKKCIQEENILKVSKFKEIVTNPNYKESIFEKQHQIIIELTERCNLRCKYCIYNDEYTDERSFGHKDMTEETAIKAIDCLAKNSIKSKDVAVTFYGGEPLIKIDLIKKCIAHAQKVLADKELTFSLTTNLTLVTPEIAEYLASVKGMVMVCSLDGPEEINDKYRVDVQGKGAFSRAIRGLRYLIEAFGDRAASCLSINMVYAPPYSFEKLNRIKEFYEENTWIPKDLVKKITYPSEGSIHDVPEEELKKQQDNSNNTLLDFTVEGFGEGAFSEKILDDVFLKINRSPVFDEPVEQIGMNACCTPGSRRVYVTVDGNFKICERVGNTAFIGNVEDNMNAQVIKEEYIDGYVKNSYEDCSTCWAARLCNLCYLHSYENGKFSIDKKRRNCEGTRELMQQNLSIYYNLLETEPEKLKYLNDMVIS